MTLFDIITSVNKQFPDTNGKDICHITNELEEKIFSEIFSPNGIGRPRPKLNHKEDINAELFLGEENLSLYLFFIFAILSIRELDFENSNAYSNLFNEKFKDLAVFYRRNYTPTKNTLLKGGI